MPTSKAVDLVAKKKGLEYFEVPTGEFSELLRNSELMQRRVEVLRKSHGCGPFVHLW
jgi:hypothetical protein